MSLLLGKYILTIYTCYMLSGRWRVLTFGITLHGVIIMLWVASRTEPQRNICQLALSSLNLPLLSSSTTSLHPTLQAANCCRNSRLVVDEDDLMWFKIKENCHVLVNQFHGIFRSKTPSCREIQSVFRDVKWCSNASWGLKGLKRGITL